MTLTPVRVLVVAAPVLVALGCPSQPVEGPPPAESLEVASAAPGARGAFAAGTDAAPPVVAPTPEEVLGDEEEPVEPVPALDAGVLDGGAEMPENLPL
jgi:hypothetical protein